MTDLQSLKQSRLAAEALTNLTVYGSIVSILEGGTLYGNGSDIEGPRQQIIKICKREQQKWLRKYDAATALLSKGSEHHER
ncbi:MAG TPA: hypothetical protein VEZ24_09550 [Microvirga sp.]|nr:hypothetical protein [Microvirga sp.]